MTELNGCFVFFILECLLASYCLRYAVRIHKPRNSFTRVSRLFLSFYSRGKRMRYQKKKSIGQVTSLIIIFFCVILGLWIGSEEKVQTVPVKPQVSKLTISYQDLDDALGQVLAASDIRRVDKNKVYEAQHRFFQSLKTDCAIADEECVIDKLETRTSDLKKMRSTLSVKY